jgi:Na+/glutamate symporter
MDEISSLAQYGLAGGLIGSFILFYCINRENNKANQKRDEMWSKALEINNEYLKNNTEALSKMSAIIELKIK